MITYEQLRDEVVRLCQTYPDAVYDYKGKYYGNCYYTKGCVNGLDTEGCLFGQALCKLEGPQRLAAQDVDVIADIMNTLLAYPDLAPLYRTWMRKAQEAQDSGTPWGQVYSEIIAPALKQEELNDE